MHLSNLIFLAAFYQAHEHIAMQSALSFDF